MGKVFDLSGKDLTKTDTTLRVPEEPADAAAVGKQNDAQTESLKAEKSRAEGAEQKLQQQVDTLNAGGLNLKEDLIRTQVDSYLTQHPEAMGTALAEETTRAKAAEEANAQGIGQLKEDLGNIADEIVRDNLVDFKNASYGYFTKNGENEKLIYNDEKKYKNAKNVKIPKNTTILYGVSGGYSRIAFLADDLTVISFETLSSSHETLNTIPIPQNAKYFSLFWGVNTATEIEGTVFISSVKKSVEKCYYNNFIMPNMDILSMIPTLFDNKIFLFSGDSITYGTNWRPTPDDYSTTGWRKLVQEKYPAAKTYGYGVGGTTIAVRENRTDSIYERISTMYAEHPDADYIILQGGINDCWNSVPLGAISDGYADTLDATTFCGAMEKMLKESILNWKGKKIGFICTYKIKGADNSAWNFKSYIDKAKEICDKWSVPYCDLYNGSGLCLKLDDIANAYSDGGTHVNKLGYRIIFPKIDAWLKTL